MRERRGRHPCLRGDYRTLLEPARGRRCALLLPTKHHLCVLGIGGCSKRSRKGHWREEPGAPRASRALAGTKDRCERSQTIHRHARANSSSLPFFLPRGRSCSAARRALRSPSCAPRRSRTRPRSRASGTRLSCTRACGRIRQRRGRERRNIVRHQHVPYNSASLVYRWRILQTRRISKQWWQHHAQRRGERGAKKVQHTATHPGVRGRLGGDVVPAEQPERC